MEQTSGSPTTKKRFSVGAIGIGQGGTSAASTVIQALGGDTNRLISINLSDADLKGATLVPEQNRILLDPNRFGAGKRRDVSKMYANEKTQLIIDNVHRALNDETNINFVFYSLDGGTGSGLGPILTALFESNAYPKARPCLFIGVPLLPDANAGEQGLSNTIEALKEISKLSQNKVARFLLVDNNNAIDSSKDEAVRWQKLNSEIAKYIKRYLFTTYTSSVSNLDFEDRYIAISVPGCHSFCSFDAKTGNTPIGPFVLPEGALVKKCASEIPAGTSEARQSLISTIGCKIDEPGMNGFYPVETQGASPIIHFAGFSNLSRITERYQNWFSQIKQKSIAAAKVDSMGAGFDRIGENKDWIETQNETSTDNSMQDLCNMINGD